MPLKQLTIYKIRSASIILISSGYGWAGGHYIPSNSPAVAYLFQFIVISFLVIFSINYLSLVTDKKAKSSWSVKGLSIFSVLSLLANIFNVIHGAYNSDNLSYGSHNSFADLVPITLIVIGTSLWLVTLIPKLKSAFI